MPTPPTNPAHDPTTSPTTTPGAAADRLQQAMRRAGTAACVGIDPSMDLMPESLRALPTLEALRAFAAGVVDAASGVVGVVKPQSACFERFGSAGVAELERCVSRAKDRGLFVILDAKRGDIGSTSAHYAAAAASMGADAVTVNGYLGTSGIEPFLDAGLMVFVLVRTSNPDSDLVQSCELAAGGSVAGRVADLVSRLGSGRAGAAGLSGVGAVVGATKAADGSDLRARMPDQCFLVPGYGAQGGTIDQVRSLRRARGAAGVVVNASRSVTYPPLAGRAWPEAVRAAVTALAGELSGLVEAGG